LSATTPTYGGRYEVLERVGAGGMADVYRARDSLLGRDVALKVLSERFAGDRSFVERFRREAQAAANLSHPNIVSLYDYGAEGSTYFIVMEFIEGRPLSDIINTEGPLLPERAAEIASDVAKALQRAHSAGLVHRDIKPGNIMVTTGGQTKVTDFGIVRALGGDAEQTMTQAGMVIGTAAYLSPEQAQGEAIDPRADIYSLGCVLYEMFTGRAPFTGETPLAIAYKHVREQPQPPSSFNPDVPASLDAITLKAMAKRPDDRYSSAKEMQADLDRFLSGQKVHAEPAWAGTTMVAPAAASGTRVMQQYEEEEAEPRGRGPGWYVALALIILGVFALLAWLLASNFLDQGRQVTVPDVVEMDVERATRILEDRGLAVDTDEKQSRKPEGEVLEQDPEAGETAREGDTVTLTVSEGLPDVEVPELEGLTLEEAREELEDARLRLGEVTRQTDDEVPEGEVLDQTPDAGTEIEARSKVDVVVSGGRAIVTVPGVVGMTESEAIDEIQDAGLRVEITRGPSDDYEEGIVAGQDPDEGTEVDEGSTVVIFVSEGADERPMPDVRGQDGDEAEANLESDYELNVSQQNADPSRCGAQPPGTVCYQDPPPGTPVSPGDDAVLYVLAGGADGTGDGWIYAMYSGLFLLA
jgi:beta-lactam-binding protein with PASTA domain/predicted Ser/Thr protein kinase